MLTQLPMFAADLVAVSVLVFALYLPRHGRRDLIVAYLGVNVGVMAVAAALAANSVSAGLGLGLFGVLSIIRLRSDELAQHEVAYYFAALALGLLGGLTVTSRWFEVALMAAVLAAVYVGDHPRITARQMRAMLLLDRAHLTAAGATTHATALLGTRVHAARVVKVDLVNDTTLVEVRHDPSPDPEAGTGHAGPVGPAEVAVLAETGARS